MRNVLVWVVGIVVTVALFSVLTIIVSELHLPTWIDYDEPITVSRGSGRYSYEEEESGESTALGYWVLIVSIMFGTRAAMVVREGRLDGGLNENQRLQFWIWFAGLTVYMVLSTALWRFLGRINHIVGFNLVMLIDIGMAIISLLAWKWVYDRRARPAVKGPSWTT